MHTQKLALNHIRLDGDTQPRVDLDGEQIDNYAQAMLDGEAFPPLTVFHDGEHYWLADGFHRYHAARKADRHSIAVQVRSGTVDDARDYACSADNPNARHGVRETLHDKRRRVRLMIRHHADWTDARLAQHCGVHHATVAKLRDDDKPVGAEDKRVGADGKQYPASKPRPSAASQESVSFDDDAGSDSAPAPEPWALRDEVGQLVPDDLAHVFRSRDALNDCAQDLAVAGRRAAAIAIDTLKGAHLHHQSVGQHVDDAVKRLLAAKPYAVCPGCKGKGCQACAKSGWMPKKLYVDHLDAHA